MEDLVTRRLRPLADAWRPADTLDDNHLAQAIYNDRTDVLVELSGLTHGHCLSVMQMRPAPVGVSYLGYPNTTGLSSINVRLVDSITDPPGPPDTLATERLVRLDTCFLCYAPPEDAPAWTAALRSLLAAPVRRAAPASTARRNVEKYTWLARAEKILGGISPS